MEEFICLLAKLSPTHHGKKGHRRKRSGSSSEKLRQTAPHVALRNNGSKNKNLQGNQKQMLSSCWMTECNGFEVYRIALTWTIQKRPLFFQRQRRNCLAALKKMQTITHFGYQHSERLFNIAVSHARKQLILFNWSWLQKFKQHLAHWMHALFLCADQTICFRPCRTIGRVSFLRITFSFILVTCLIRGGHNLRAEVTVTEDCFRTEKYYIRKRLIYKWGLKMSSWAIKNLKRTYSFQHLTAEKSTVQDADFLFLLFISFS